MMVIDQSWNRLSAAKKN